MILEPETFLSKWNDYMLSRRGDYAFRSRTRYAAVADCLFAMGLHDGHVVTDIGAGSCQFFHYLSRERGWTGRYAPVDAVLDGTDLNEWTPRIKSDFMVCIEVLEHLYNPERMMRLMKEFTVHGAVATTPNPAAVDVIACDPTHVSIIPAEIFQYHGWVVWERSFFGIPADTLLACDRVPVK